MDTAVLISFLKESLFFIIVFGGFLAFSMTRGAQALVNIILSLYFALLISLEFPFYDVIHSSTGGSETNPLFQIGIFVFFAIIASLLFGKLMPAEFEESSFDSFGKKALLAISATILVMIFSFHVLPVTEFVTPGTPIQYLFSSEGNFFWWLLLPLVALSFL